MKEVGFLTTKKQNECLGCEACAQKCSAGAIQMALDSEGFRYPNIDLTKCVSCGMCHKVCPIETGIPEWHTPRTAFGGHHKNRTIQRESTSGGAFSAIVDGWCDENSVIFGAVSDGLQVRHRYVVGIADIDQFRKSKYLQSRIGNAYCDAQKFLQEGRKVLFSGTPCQIAGLKSFLGADPENLLTVEVVCEGVPSPKFIASYDSWLEAKYSSGISSLDYRNKDRPKWDFEIMKTTLKNGRQFHTDRWVNPFWSIWLAHLMSRPSCYQCPFANLGRVADITLGDLWGVHKYCPDLYDRNRGASLILCNTSKGKIALAAAVGELAGRELDIQTALKYQGPLRSPISTNPQRTEFMVDIDKLPYDKLCRKWAKHPKLRLLWSKYIWGNRQKMFLWEITHRREGQEG